MSAAPGRGSLERAAIGALYAAVALVVPLVRLRAAFADVQSRIPYADDAFYYLQIAWNIAHGRGSTFGTTPTNGYHPLYLLVLVPLAKLSATKEAFLRCSYLLHAALWALAVTAAFAIHLRTRRTVSGLLALTYFAWYGATWAGRGSDLFHVGMESSLVVALLLSFAALFLRLDLSGEARVLPRALLPAGCVLALAVLARLDSVFLLPALSGLLLWRLRGVKTPPKLVVLGALIGPSLVCLCGYMLVSKLSFGIATPISGRAKALGAPAFAWQSLEQALAYGYYYKLPLLAGAVTLSCAAALLFASWRARLARGVAPSSACSTNELLLIAAFLGCWLVQVGYLFAMVRWFVWGWYFYVVSVIAILAIPPAIDALAERLGFRGRALNVALFCGGLGALALPAHYAHRVFGVRTFIDRSRAVAAWLSAHTPANAVYAMGDRAGALGFFLDRPIYQLEGIVNDARYLSALEQNEVDRTWLLANGVRYLVTTRDVAVHREAAGGVDALLLELRFGNGAYANIAVRRSELLYEAEFEDGPISVWALGD